MGSMDLVSEPLAYPGVPVDSPGLLTATRFTPRHTLDLRDRRPVLCVGSNGNADQLRRKLAERSSPLEVPITIVEVHDLMVGVSSHVSRPGYLPATPVIVPGERSTLPVIWLDPAQLVAIDMTEPNYNRVELSNTWRPQTPAGDSGQPAACDAYVSRRGYLVDDDGRPLPLMPQRTLIERLLVNSSELRSLAGNTAVEFVAAMRGAAIARDRVAEIFRASGWVGG